MFDYDRDLLEMREFIHKVANSKYGCDLEALEDPKVLAEINAMPSRDMIEVENDQLQSDIEWLRAENERRRVENERLRAENERLRAEMEQSQKREEIQTQKREEPQSATDGSRITFKINDVEFKFVKVTRGRFKKGATPEMEANANNYPVKDVVIKDDFYMGETVVTQQQWEAVMGFFSNNHSYTVLSRGNEIKCPIGDAYPAVIDKMPDLFLEKINKYDLSSYIKTSRKAKFCLPSLEEWEYAARGGNQSKHYKWAGGNIINRVAWNKFNSDGTLHKVAELQPNELGLYDMSGNVMELCSDGRTRGDFDYGLDSIAEEPFVSSRFSYLFDDNVIGFRLVMRF